MNKYKVGNPIVSPYKDAPVPYENQFKPGQRVNISDIDTGNVLAVFEVISTNENEASGVIIRTNGNKRRGN